jgi:hypothetical protein
MFADLSITTQILIEHFTSTGRVDGWGAATCGTDRGKWVFIALRLRRNRIVEARFLTSRYSTLRACAWALTRLVTGWHLGCAINLHPSELSALLQLPPSKDKFSHVALEALWDAIRDAEQRGRCRIWRTFGEV